MYCWPGWRDCSGEPPRYYQLWAARPDWQLTAASLVRATTGQLRQLTRNRRAAAAGKAIITSLLPFHCRNNQSGLDRFLCAAMMAGESVVSALLLCLARPATAISCTAQLADLDCLPAFSHSPPDSTKAPTARLAPGLRPASPAAFYLN